MLNGPVVSSIILNNILGLTLSGIFWRSLALSVFLNLGGERATDILLIEVYEGNGKNKVLNAVKYNEFIICCEEILVMKERCLSSGLF